MNGIYEVARREFSARLRSKGFWAGLVASCLAIVALVVVPTLFDEKSSFSVALSGPQSAALKVPLAAVGENAGLDLVIHRVSSDAIRSEVEAGTYDVAVVDGERLLTHGTADPALVEAVQTARQAVSVRAKLAGHGLSDEQIDAALTVTPLAVVTVGGERSADHTRQGIAIAIMLSLLLLLMTSAVGVAIGVVEEKGSRIVEILLSVLRPSQLLGGKLLAYGVLGLLQLVAFAASGLGAAHAVGLTDDLPQGSATIALATGAGYLLGFLFFASLAAALSSLVSRQEEVNSALAPMTALMVGTYLGAFLAMQEPTSTSARVLSVVPPFSSMVMPVRASTEDVPALEIAAAIGLMLLVVVLIVWTGSRVYERSVLRMGARVRLSEIWRDDLEGHLQREVERS